MKVVDLILTFISCLPSRCKKEGALQEKHRNGQMVRRMNVGPSHRDSRQAAEMKIRYHDFRLVHHGTAAAAGSQGLVVDTVAADSQARLAEGIVGSQTLLVDKLDQRRNLGQDRRQDQRRSPSVLACTGRRSIESGNLENGLQRDFAGVERV